MPAVDDSTITADSSASAPSQRVGWFEVVARRSPRGNVTTVWAA